MNAESVCSDHVMSVQPLAWWMDAFLQNQNDIISLDECHMRVCDTHRARLDFQVPLNSTWQQEQLSLGAPPSLHANNQSEGGVTQELTPASH